MEFPRQSQMQTPSFQQQQQLDQMQSQMRQQHDAERRRAGGGGPPRFTVDDGSDGSPSGASTFAIALLVALASGGAFVVSSQAGSPSLSLALALLFAGSICTWLFSVLALFVSEDVGETYGEN